MSYDDVSGVCAMTHRLTQFLTIHDYVMIIPSIVLRLELYLNMSCEVNEALCTTWYRYNANIGDDAAGTYHLSEGGKR